MIFIHCQNCNRKLLKVGKFDQLSIKCQRCKALNHLSVENALSENHEFQTKEVTTRGNKSISSSTAPIYRAKAIFS
ncbi:MAG: Com family DNA-binding transcriptional regulator [Moraxellaceae bacterium]|nr:Com family DNA-binding transcriptional regulator [Moraxellaceae bacterium]